MVSRRGADRAPKQADALKHDEARRVNVPTAELQSLAEQQEEVTPREAARYPRARPLAGGGTPRAR